MPKKQLKGESVNGRSWLKFGGAWELLLRFTCLDNLEYISSKWENVFATEKYVLVPKIKLYFYSEERYVQEKHMQ